MRLFRDDTASLKDELVGLRRLLAAERGRVGSWQVQVRRFEERAECMRLMFEAEAADSQALRAQLRRLGEVPVCWREETGEYA